MSNGSGGQQGMEISRDDIFETIGEQQVEIRMLRKQLLQAHEQLTELTRIKAELQKLKDKQ